MDWCITTVIPHQVGVAVRVTDHLCDFQHTAFPLCDLYAVPFICGSSFCWVFSLLTRNVDIFTVVSSLYNATLHTTTLQTVVKHNYPTNHTSNLLPLTTVQFLYCLADCTTHCYCSRTIASAGCAVGSMMAAASSDKLCGDKLRWKPKSWVAVREHYTASLDTPTYNSLLPFRPTILDIFKYRPTRQHTTE